MIESNNQSINKFVNKYMNMEKIIKAIKEGRMVNCTVPFDLKFDNGGKITARVSKN